MFRYEPPPAWPPWCIRTDCSAGDFRWIIKDKVTGRDWLPEGESVLHASVIELRPVIGPLCAPVTLADAHGMLVVCVHASCNTIEIEGGQPCMTCGWEYNCEDCQSEEAYNRWLDERVQRLGVELAMLPDRIECYTCGRNPLMLLTPSRLDKGDLGFKFVWRRPVGLGPVVEERRDPTQTYRLECGHLEM
jgi:hypothetical protein